ncbi:ABC transporter substrate-binding protein [Rhizobium sp. 768_B6_N1_8]|uniref:ABC transporter substrate-binding protein n=1 Tax=unclassified Rhizobium TaxID=2613769 RepID=UPI003F27EA81
MKFLIPLTLSLAFAAASGPAKADRLDDIIANGTLRCAVMLDFPPMGARDEAQQPIGFDVDTCNDLAKVLGVKAEIVETPLPDRIPALMSGRADIAIASASDTLERAKTVGFTIPYFAFKSVVLVRKDSGIDNYDGLKGKDVGTPAGSTEGIALEADVKKWGGGDYKAFQTQADVLLALSQGQIAGTVLPSTVAATVLKSGKFPDLAEAGDAPYVVDYVAFMVPREEFGVINYLNLFINQQSRTGRYAELYKKWIGDNPANLTVTDVYR